MSESKAAGCRVLVVEDEMLIAIEIEDVLQEMGCEIVGPVGRLDEAMAMATTERLDAAILDVTIRGGTVFPVADILTARGVPFLLASGYGDWALPEELRDRPRLTKPFSTTELQEQVMQMCRKGEERS